MLRGLDNVDEVSKAVVSARAKPVVRLDGKQHNLRPAEDAAF
jgi:very-short-patch-repair endonuclease